MLRYQGQFLAIDASDLFADPEFQKWLEAAPRARWKKAYACCDALFAWVDARILPSGEFQLDGSDITLEDPQVPRAAIELIERAMREAGLEEFEGIVWLSDEGA